MNVHVSGASVIDLGEKYSVVFKVLHLSILAAACLCILLAVINPTKNLQLYPYPGVAAYLFSDSVESEGTSVASGATMSEPNAQKGG